MVRLLVCTNPPEGFDRWTLELVRERAIKDSIVNSISKEKVRIILKEHCLKPWQQKMWCIPKLDNKYIERMENILDLYERGDTQENPIVCLDEKAVFLRGDSREAMLGEPGVPKKVDYEYIRNGKVNVFFGIEPFGGNYKIDVTERRTKKILLIFKKFV